MKKETVLSVAGIDTGNGAGAEADLKTFEILGLHGLMVITAITAQNTQGIKGILPISSEFLRLEIATLKNDFEIKGVKVGMIYDKAQFEVVNELLKEVKPFVVDPVIYAKDGTQLIKDLDEYKRLIIRDSTVLTPNIPEASLVSGMSINSLEDAIKAGKKIKEEYNVDNVIIKGGHLSGSWSFDVLISSSDEIYQIGYPRIPQRNTHGTGSVFASAVLGYLVKGFNIKDAFSRAKALVYNAIIHGLEIGKGIGPIDPIVDLEKKAMKYDVIQDMIKFSEFVTASEKFYLLVPEVQSNLAHSINPSYVEGLEDIATFKGRITRDWDNKVRVGLPPVFGKPTHTARLLFSIISKGIQADSVINIRYDERIIRLLRMYGYEVVEVNRELEPPHGEGKTMQWIVDKVYEEYGKKFPNVIYDKGAKGKEAMIRLWTKSINEMMETLNSLCRDL